MLPAPLSSRAVDFVLVEEGNEFALRAGREVGLDALNKLRNAALLVVAARVGDEKVVGHGDRLSDLLTHFRIPL